MLLEINSRGREAAQRLRNNRDGFYSQFAKVLMVQDDGELQRAMVRMDGPGEAGVSAKPRKLSAPRIRGVKMLDSARHPLEYAPSLPRSPVRAIAASKHAKRFTWAA